MTEEKIQRINELYRKSKSPVGLTAEEKAEQERLRTEFRRGVKANLEGQLQNIEIVDKER
ncbi:MAG: DUF896 domain-containing protein [Ruminococcus sp.]|nr:DUF896 domain-containing protein [Ruminococcus sp.]